MSTCFSTQPDYTRLEKAIKREKPDRLPVYEFFSDINIQLAAIGDHPKEDNLPLGDRDDMNNHIIAQYYLGYDYLSPWVQFGFSGLQWTKTENLDGQQKNRHYLDEKNTPIKTREDFEKYIWPTPAEVDYADLEYCAGHLPEGMKLIVNLGGGLLEWAMWLMGTEDFLMALYDDPSLVRDVIAKVNEQQCLVAKQAASHPDVFACIMGDDMGFKTQTFLTPDSLREYVFPGHKNVVEAVHSEGKLFMLHSCGNLDLVMDDLIDFVQIDGKHSYEDVITPVWKAKELWGRRVALLGGVDVDVLCRAPEDELRSYVRNVVAKCGPSGFAVGSGNSIADYVPPGQLRIMLDEAIRCQQ